MTLLKRNCFRCGDPMVFDTEAMDEEELRLSRLANRWSHPEGHCPKDIPDEDPHTYRVEVRVFKDDDPEPHAGVSASVEGTSFEAVTDQAAEALNKNWVRLLEMAAMVDG